jgi:hypothetical protein
VPLGSDDLGRCAPEGKLASRRPGAEDDVDTTHVDLDHHRRISDELDVEADLLAHLTPRGVRWFLVAHQQAARESPPIPVPLTDQHDVTISLDDAQRTHGVGGSDRPDDDAADSTWQPAEHDEQETVESSDHSPRLLVAPPSTTAVQNPRRASTS